MRGCSHTAVALFPPLPDTVHLLQRQGPPGPLQEDSLAAHLPKGGEKQNRIRFTKFEPLRGLFAAIYYFLQQHQHSQALSSIPSRNLFSFFLNVDKLPSNCLISICNALNNLGPVVTNALSLNVPSPDLTSGGSMQRLPSLEPSPYVLIFRSSRSKLGASPMMIFQT